MKKSILLIAILAMVVELSAQNFRGEYYDTQREMQESIEMEKGALVMMGNSITERGRWSEYFPEKLIYNRGIGGDIIAGMQDRLEPIMMSQPSKIFIMAGVNNLIFFAMTLEEYRTQMQTLIGTIRKESPRTKIYIQSILPVNADAAPENNRTYFEGKNPQIEMMNAVLKKLAKELNTTYIDIYSIMTKDGALNPDYTIDGIHLSAKGYLSWVEILKPYIK